MKGQFMVISAVVISLIVITTASTIAETESKRFRPDTEAYQVKMIEQEAGKVDTTSIQDRKSFGTMLESFDRYSSTTEYWGAQDCFNVTLRDSSTHMELNVPDC